MTEKPESERERFEKWWREFDPTGLIEQLHNVARTSWLASAASQHPALSEADIQRAIEAGLSAYNGAPDSHSMNVANVVRAALATLPISATARQAEGWEKRAAKEIASAIRLEHGYILGGDWEPTIGRVILRHAANHAKAGAEKVTAETILHLCDIAHQAFHVLDDADHDDIRAATVAYRVDMLSTAIDVFAGVYEDPHELLQSIRAVLTAAPQPPTVGTEGEGK